MLTFLAMAMAVLGWIRGVEDFGFGVFRVGGSSGWGLGLFLVGRFEVSDLA